MEYMESKMQDYYDAGNAIHAELEKVTAERDALVAQVEAKDKEIEEIKAVTMRLAKQSGVLASVSEQLKTFCKNLTAGNIPEFHKAEALRIALSYEDALIKQHLTEVKAQAVKDFIEFMYKSNDCQLCSESLDKAIQYADSIRQENK